MVPEARWGFDRPLDRVQYNREGAPAVVEYAHGTSPLKNYDMAQLSGSNASIMSWRRITGLSKSI